MRYWCLCSSRENWEVCKTHSVFGFDWRYLPTLEKFVRPNDHAIAYVHGGSFVATAEITGPWFEDPRPIGWTKGKKPYLFPARLPIQILQEGVASIAWTVDHDERTVLERRQGLLNDIEFIADKGRTWNQYVQVSIVRITQSDYETVARALARSNSAPSP